MKKIFLFSLFILSLFILIPEAQAQHKDIKLICEPHCPQFLLEKNRLKKIKSYFKRTLQNLEKVHASSIPKNLRPLNVHIINGPTCQSFSKKYNPSPLLPFAFFDERKKLIICLNTVPENLLKNSPHFAQIVSRIIDPGLPFPIIAPDFFAEQRAAQLNPETLIKIICQSAQCQKYATRKLLKKIQRNLVRDLLQFEEAVGVEIAASRKPFEVHIGPDDSEFCRSSGQFSPFGSTSINYQGKGVICLNTTFDRIVSGQTSFFHELGHHYFMEGGDQELIEELVSNMNRVLHPKLNLSAQCPPIWKQAYSKMYALCRDGFNFGLIKNVIERYRKIAGLYGTVSSEKFESILGAVIVGKAN